MAEDRLAFHAALVAAGLLVETGVPGLYGRSGAFEHVVEGIEGVVGRAGAERAPVVLRFPPVVGYPVIHRSGYLRSFPHLVGSVHAFAGDERAHGELLDVLEGGGDWSAGFQTTEMALCAAACHPVYPTLTGVVPAGGRTLDVYGWVFRHEPSLDPGRMQAFRQYEHVFVGEADDAVNHRDLWTERGLNILSDLGIEARAEVANDPFFGRGGRLLSFAQRDEALKYELVGAIGPGEGATALVSSNCHKDFFGTAFAITTVEGTVAHSACVGFGVERIALALFHAHGFDSQRWPGTLRATLWT